MKSSRNNAGARGLPSPSPAPEQVTEAQLTKSRSKDADVPILEADLRSRTTENAWSSPRTSPPATTGTASLAEHSGLTATAGVGSPFVIVPTQIISRLFCIGFTRLTSCQIQMKPAVRSKTCDWFAGLEPGLSSDGLSSQAELDDVWLTDFAQRPQLPLKPPATGPDFDSLLAEHNTAYQVYLRVARRINNFKRYKPTASLSELLLHCD